MRTEANRLAKVNFGPEMLQTIGYIYARAGAKVGLLLARAAQCIVCGTNPCTLRHGVGSVRFQQAVMVG